MLGGTTVEKALSSRGRGRLRGRCYPPSPISLLLTFQEAQTVAVCLSSRDAGVVRERTGHTALTPLGHHELVHVNNWGLGSCLEALSLWMESVNLTLTVW